MPLEMIESLDLDPKTFSGAGSTAAACLAGPRLHFGDRPFPRLFEDQAAHKPAKIAVACEGDSLTFRELNARANQLARHLRALGVGRESLVGICIDRSLEMVVGILGILKAGGAYLPLDPEYPSERLAFMIADAKPALILTKSNLTRELAQVTDRIVLVDRDWSAISRYEVTDLDDAPATADLAYVIYTSGSTGQPKGVMITHGNLANYLNALNHELQISAKDKYLHTASMAFSSSRRQMMLPLSQGATVVIATSEQRTDTLALLEMIKQREVTVMDAVPSFWRHCTTILSDLSTSDRQRLLDNRVRLMLSASEPMLSDIPRTWQTEFRHPARHIHMFGQTETAGIVCVYRVPEDLDEEVTSVPVGQPIANTEVYVLDEQRLPCAPGVAGELYIGGAGVGRGYLNRPDLTAEKFVMHSFGGDAGKRLYRTGDWARLGESGNIEFAGRRDQQVKLRGFRIELGEVETALARHPHVRESAVIARGETAEEKRLIAYFVTDGAQPGASELRNFLSTQVPEFAIPSSFVQLAALPLSANGKVNRLALPETNLERSQLSITYLAPRNQTEERLTSIWIEVLRLPWIGVSDNFFELGGHSLLAAQIISRVRREFGIEIPLRTIFERPTIEQLASQIDVNGSENQAGEVTSIRAIERNGAAPLSFAQQQFWLLDQAAGNRAAYNVHTAVRLAGALNVQRLREALEQIVSRHEVLRTRIVLDHGTPVQLISPPAPLVFPISDLTTLAPAEREGELERAMAAEAEKPFDLSCAPLLRCQLFKLDNEEHVLLLIIHHIACDGWSIGLLHRELSALYEATGKSSGLPELPIQYRDFAQWQRQVSQSELFNCQLDYWRKTLAGAPMTLDVPADYAPPTRRSLAGATRSVQLSRELSNGLKTLTRNENATLFMTLLAGFQALLFRYSGQEDVVVGSPAAGRTRFETESLIGAFVNTLVLRSDVSGNPTFREFLGRVRETVLGAFANQEVPFERVVEELNPDRSLNRSPLFQVMFAMQNTPEPDLDLAGLKLTPIRLESTTSKFDLSLEVAEQAEGLVLTFEYSTDLFAPETIERMLAHFQNLLSGVVADPAQRVAELNLLSPIEREQLLVDWNQTASDFPIACVHKLFEAQVAKTPDAVAAEFRGEQLTYRELNQRANRLAHHLQKQGIVPEIMVGICVERSLEMLVSILAVLKAGGAYLPLDPNYPHERIAFMIEDAGLTLVLTQPNLSAVFDGTKARLLFVEESEAASAHESVENPATDVTPNNLAYLIYTSGSTGNPKGVMVEHRSLGHFTSVAAKEYSIHPGDRVLQFASLSFDLSAEEIYPALARGATLVLRTEEMIGSAADFCRYCDEWKISVLDLPTAYWHELVDESAFAESKRAASLRLVIIGGEKAQPERVIAWQQMTRGRVRLMNTYGPTETTVVATTYDVKPDVEIDRRQNVSIGRPIANTTTYVLDKFLQPVPVGVAGALYIGGAGVTRGYLNRPDLTAEKFVANPFSSLSNSRLYKTGDLVRYRPDGNIEFLGRVDNQIKIRGFRVELEEIEQALRAHDAVGDCVVVLREDKDNDKRLVAYVVARAPARPAVSELRSFLKTKLPTYMVPASFELIDALPVMPNGKIDRRALPEPETRVEPDEGFIAPRTPIEELLATAWREVLKLEQIGVHDNFFDLGGHSLLAAKVVSSVRNVLDVEFGMVDIFQAPTIATLAELLYPRTLQPESDAEFAALLEEMAELSDEGAQLCLDQESQTEGVAAA